MTSETRTITVSARRIWVYHVNLPMDDAFAAVQEPVEKWDENDELVPWPMAVALGLKGLDHDFVECAWLPDTGGTAAEYIKGSTGVADAALDDFSQTTGQLVVISMDPDDDRLSRAPDAPFAFLGDFEVPSYSYDIPAPSQTSRSKPNPPVDTAVANRGLRILFGLILAAAAFVWILYNTVTGGG